MQIEEGTTCRVSTKSCAAGSCLGMYYVRHLLHILVHMPFSSYFHSFAFDEGCHLVEKYFFRSALSPLSSLQHECSDQTVCFFSSILLGRLCLIRSSWYFEEKSSTHDDDGRKWRHVTSAIRNTYVDNSIRAAFLSILLCSCPRTLDIVFVI